MITMTNSGLPVAGINNSQGITRTIAGGINYSDVWKKNRSERQLSV